MNGEDAADADGLRGSIVRRVGGTLAALLAAAAFAGMLPGATVFLGLLNSDALADLARSAGAVLLAQAVIARDETRLTRRLQLVGAMAVAFGAVALIDPHLSGLLPSGVSTPESIVAGAFGLTALAAARVAASTP